MKYDNLGNQEELSAALAALWQNKLSEIFDTGIQVARNEVVPPHNKSWLFNPLRNGKNNTVVADIKWNAFPKRLLDQFASKVAAWREADSSRQKQEEYCEWEVVRDPNTQVVKRVTFTTEVPEYYEFLFNNSPEFLLELYRKYVSNKASLSDLTDADGLYNARNIWNYPERQGKRGVLLHMGFGPNTLDAAVKLSAEATWPSIDSSGNLITDEQGLIDCRGFGARERHSDPHIGAQINALVRAGNEVSFASPAGLYIDSIDLSGFEIPSGDNVEDIYRVIRGAQNHMMRVVFEAPPGSGFDLGAVKIDGNPIRFGGQIAEKLTIRIRGIARNIESIPPSINCSGNVAGSSFSMIAMSGTRKQTVEFISSNE